MFNKHTISICLVKKLFVLFYRLNRTNQAVSLRKHCWLRVGNCGNNQMFGGIWIKQYAHSNLKYIDYKFVVFEKRLVKFAHKLVRNGLIYRSADKVLISETNLKQINSHAHSPVYSGVAHTN